MILRSLGIETSGLQRVQSLYRIKAMQGLIRNPLKVGASPAELISQIQAIIQSQLNGRIYIRSATESWHLDFRVGRLVWASGGHHRFRRWQRSLKRFCPDLSPTQVQLREKELFDHWEYLALTVMLKRQQISREDAVSLSRATLLEVLFDIFQSCDQLQEISHTSDRQSCLPEPLGLFSNSELLGEAQSQFATWQALGLGEVSPNLAPIIRDLAGLSQATSTKTFKTLRTLLQGRLSFRDLTVIMRHDLGVLGRSLSSYMRREFVATQGLPDLDSPFAAPPGQPVPAKSVENLPLVFCIDDSPQICYIMEETLRAAGYRCKSIQDSIQALPNLIRQKPALIFLDLVMPVANGYEICSQIRRVASLRKIPVIILTGNDGVVDRVRAKAVGATDFMAKPVEPERVAQVVARYLQVPKAK